MEESGSANELSLSMSGWKLKQQGLKNQRNHRQLENRLLILQLERQNKIKSIQKKLQTHKKLMQIRMDRLKLKQSLQKHDQQIVNQANDNSKIFKDIRINRAHNIKSRNNLLKESNNRLFRDIKQQRVDNQKIIQEENMRVLSVKTQKRNRVRMIEIQCKENISKFWRKRLSNFREKREKQISRNMQIEEKKMEYLMNLQKSQAQLLSQIKRTQQMESQLLNMMNQQRSMLNATLKS